MKTIEQKAKAYDEALEIAKKELQVCGSTDCDAAKQIFRFFPELKENEDERIRKALIKFHKSTIDIDDIKGDEIVAWLEKQGEKDILEDAVLDGWKSRYKYMKWLIKQYK